MDILTPSGGVKLDNEVLAEVDELHDNPDANPRAALGALLFSGNDVFKKTSNGPVVSVTGCIGIDEAMQLFDHGRTY